MALLSLPVAAEAPEASRPILAAVERQLGMVPNLYRLIANSPKALAGFVAFNSALAKGLDLKTRERIALAVAEVNGCDYCLAAHSYIAENLARLPVDEIERARRGGSAEAKAQAAVAFAAHAARARGHVAEADVAAVRAAGYSDGEIVEIVALVAENMFTNILNSVARTDIDFPAVRAAEAA